MRRVSPEDAALGRLIALSDEYLGTLYPPDSNHLETLAAIALYEKLGYALRGPFGPYAPDPLTVFMDKRMR